MWNEKKVLRQAKGERATRDYKSGREPEKPPDMSGLCGMPCEKTETLFDRDGMIFVRLVCTLPAVAADEKASEARTRVALFYQTVSKEVGKVIGTKLMPKLTAAYDADGDPRKRYRFRPTELRLTVRAVGDNTFRRRISLFAGEEKTLSESSDRFDVSTGRLVPRFSLLKSGQKVGSLPKSGRQK